ncbi:M15 family metallopeptidase [Patulibacter sp. SYSU D01012]|uniref:M15 family metallopeptidase n=1 Tax=Patulibacter sp. SYSU D01012 TaxID=2817381 RepID=UPI001B3093A6|nr:M15 family metallopeptidase [Patulibacter sp. SYSU D01012]
MTSPRPRRAPVLLAATAVAAFALAAGPSSRAPGGPTPTAAATVVRALGPQDGYVPSGQSVSPFTALPAVARLEPSLRTAIRSAARDARRDRVTLRVNSGWRSAAYQDALFRRAVRTYGSRQAAMQYVLPATLSNHVRGAAVDVGPPPAAAWLARNGTRYGLCRTYANESWHFERKTRRGGTCPPQAPTAADAVGARA